MSKDPVKIAQECLYEGTESLFKTFPKAIERIISERLWEQRTDRNGEPFKSFEAFVTHRLWHGLEIKSISKLLDFVQEDPKVVKMVEGEVEGCGDHGGANNPNGKNQHTKQVGQVDNINLTNDEPKGGTSATYLLKRLKRDAPEMAEAYIQGEYKSVRAAAIAAGIVKVPTEFSPPHRLYKTYHIGPTVRLFCHTTNDLFSAIQTPT